MIFESGSANEAAKSTLPPRVSRSRLAASVPVGSRFGGPPKTSSSEKSMKSLAGDCGESSVSRT